MVYLDHEVVGPFLYVIYLWYLLSSQAERLHIQQQCQLIGPHFHWITTRFCAFFPCTLRCCPHHNCVNDYY